MATAAKGQVQRIPSVSFLRIASESFHVSRLLNRDSDLKYVFFMLQDQMIFFAIYG